MATTTIALRPAESEKQMLADYCVLCEIRGSDLVILAIEVGHRRDIHR